MLVICETFNSFLSQRKTEYSFGPLGIDSFTAHINVNMYIHGYCLYTLAFLPVCIALGVVRIKKTHKVFISAPHVIDCNSIYALAMSKA